MPLAEMLWIDHIRKQKRVIRMDSMNFTEWRSDSSKQVSKSPDVLQKMALLKDSWGHKSLVHAAIAKSKKIVMRDISNEIHWPIVWKRFCKAKHAKYIQAITLGWKLVRNYLSTDRSNSLHRTKTKKWWGWGWLNNLPAVFNF